MEQINQYLFQILIVIFLSGETVEGKRTFELRCVRVTLLRVSLLIPHSLICSTLRQDEDHISLRSLLII